MLPVMSFIIIHYGFNFVDIQYDYAFGSITFRGTYQQIQKQAYFCGTFG